MLSEQLPPRTALYVPASNAKALAKLAAPGVDMGADMVIVELEDAVRPDQKEEARAAAIEALAGNFGGAIKALRINGIGTPWHDADVSAAANSGADVVVVPKVESAAEIEALAKRLGRPVLAMIESPAAAFEARAIAAAAGVIGLIAGLNDVAHDMRLPADPAREGLILVSQMIVLAARAAGGWALDGVYNDVKDANGLAAECAQGRRWGYDGKTLIHPAQVAIANQSFAPSEAELADARELVALIEANPDGVGAIRFRDRMVEDMHIASARALLARDGQDRQRANRAGDK